jgi:hypothetical protein
MKTKLILLTAFFGLMMSCTSDDGPIEMPVNVYIAGTAYNEQNTPTAILLKNGVEQNLADALNYRSYAKKVIVDNNNVYVLGSFENENIGKSVVWKNGQIVWEANDEIARDFVVINSNLYVLTRIRNYNIFGLKYWINNTPFEIESNISFESPNSYIRVNDNKVYITSSGLYSTQSGQTAGLGIFIYNNGELNFLENSENQVLSGFEIVNNNFHITSNSFSSGSKYWTSDTFSLNFNSNINFSGLKVLDNDVYTFGQNEELPFYAINQSTNSAPFVFLPVVSFMNSTVKDIFVKNNQVYAISTNVLWINNVVQNLPSSLQAQSIFVN